MNASEVKIINSVGIAINVNGHILATCHLVPGGYKNREFRITQLKDFKPVPDIICGDFNDTNLQISGLSRLTNDETWFLEFFYKGSQVTKKYDHIYCNLHTTVVDKLSVGKYGGLSDHVPIYFRIVRMKF